jgi:hypothetical protein
MSRKTLLLALVVAAVTAACGATDARAGNRPPLIEPVEISAARAPAAGPPAVEALRAWDTQRAEAWARGDPRLLTALYMPGSVAGRHDRAMLRTWLARGLVVREMRTQLLTVQELSHTRSTWTLQVTDRLVGGFVVGPGVRRPLPRDGATTRTLRLRLVAGAWRVASVLPEEVTPQAD